MHTEIEGFTIRPAVREDAQTILDHQGSGRI